MSQRELSHKRSQQGLVLKPLGRPDERPIGRGRASTTSTTSFSTAFPIGAGSRKHSNTISTVRRPLPSPPKIMIAPTSRPLPDVVSPTTVAPTTGNLSPPAIDLHPTHPKPRARTQSATSSPRMPLVPRRPVGRNATAALGAGFDVAHNTLIIHPVKSPERSSPKPLVIRRPERSTNRVGAVTSSERRSVTSPERRPVLPSQPLGPHTRSPQISNAPPALLARRPEQIHHSRANSATSATIVPTLTPTSSPPLTPGLRLNTSFSSQSAASGLSAASVSPAVSPSPKPPPPSKSRTLPLAPLPNQSFHSLPSTIAPNSHPPGAIGSPTTYSAAPGYYGHPLRTPDSSSTADTVSTAGSLATPDSATSSSNASTIMRPGLPGRRLGVMNNVRIRSGSIEEYSSSRMGGRGAMRSAPVMQQSSIEEEDMSPIPSHLKGKGRARDSSLRLSRSMDVDEYSTFVPPSPPNPKRRRRQGSSSSSSDDQALTPSLPPLDFQDQRPLQRPQPHLLIPPSSASSAHHPFGVGGLSPASSDQEKFSPLSFQHSPHGSTSSLSFSPKPSHSRQRSLQSPPLITPSPLSRSPVSQSPIGSSEGEDEHSHPTLLEDMISGGSSVRTRDSAFYASGLTFASSRKKRRSMATDSVYTSTERIPSTQSSPVGPPSPDNDYDLHSSPVSPFSAKPGSSDGDARPESGDSTRVSAYDWAAVLNSSQPKSRPLSGASSGASKRGRVKGGRRRQSWGGRASDMSTSPGAGQSISPPSARRLSPIGRGARDGSISPIQYAKRRASEDSVFMDEGLSMDVEQEMEFAHGSSGSDEEGGLDVMGEPRARRRGPNFTRKSGVGGRMFVDDQSDHETLSARRSRSRSRRPGGRLSSDDERPPVPPVLYEGRRPSHPRSSSPALRRSLFPSIQSKVLQPSRPLIGRSSSHATPTRPQFDLSSLDYPSAIGTPFGMGLTSTSSKDTSNGIFGFTPFSSGKKKFTPNMDSKPGATRAQSVDPKYTPFGSLNPSASPSAYKTPSISSSGEGHGRPSTSDSSIQIHGGSNHSHGSGSGGAAGGGIGASPSAPHQHYSGGGSSSKKKGEREKITFGGMHPDHPLSFIA